MILWCYVLFLREFVARQLDLVRPVMESLIPPANERIISQLDQFYAKVLSAVPDARCLVFDCVASRALKLPVLVTAVSNTKWDVNELQSRHSSYIDFLIKVSFFMEEALLFESTVFSVLEMWKTA
ncbi:hypothetical protein NECAME_08817 [Necator americanus]|uniref:Syndetin C-terminal domain-containing protein n=1 Tax=Necator americanus TaxID=51031 RepID=W2TGK6_NECAM|nr:hypothetical protein NECAME_08817 [Necator americanus]ETN80968.1 hypothetical protein NECAME_08817 [Necator americanus]